MTFINTSKDGKFYEYTYCGELHKNFRTVEEAQKHYEHTKQIKKEQNERYRENKKTKEEMHIQIEEYEKQINELKQKLAELENRRKHKDNDELKKKLVELKKKELHRQQHKPMKVLCGTCKSFFSIGYIRRHNENIHRIYT
jgi:chromosome segregation ATPase